ncbi:MAG: hypothetical protein H8D67_04415 [Deltaproteobacteria bacterium]|nr:hypothetical protein [Deltaproteobacteria bacterium]
MAVTYKGVPNRERWLQPWEKFRSKNPVVESLPAEDVEPVMEVKLFEDAPIIGKPIVEKPKKKGRPKKKEIVPSVGGVKEPQDELKSEEDPWAV